MENHEIKLKNQNKNHEHNMKRATFLENIARYVAGALRDAPGFIAAKITEYRGTSRGLVCHVTISRAHIIPKYPKK